MLTWAFTPSNNTEVGSKAVTRTAKADYEEKYFSFFEEYCSNDSYSIIAKKEFKADILCEYETVAYSNDEEFEVTYDYVVNSETRTVVLNVYFDTTGEKIVENFTGCYMTNYLGEEDVLFVVDGMHIFLSEFVQMTEAEQCSVFGNLLHKTVNAGLKAFVVAEPAVKIINYVGNPAALAQSSLVSYTAFGHWMDNKQLTQPNGYIYGQNAYSNWKYHWSYLDYSGCEVIAAYNLCYALYQTRVMKNRLSLADTILLFESLGIEIGSAYGYFGANPYQISYFLEAEGISFTKVTNYKDFEKKMKDSKDYYVILSTWTGEAADDMIHTYLVDKDSGHLDKKFWAYNFYCNIAYETQRKITKVSTYGEFFEKGSISNTFVCAYFVEQ